MPIAADCESTDDLSMGFQYVNNLSVTDILQPDRGIMAAAGQNRSHWVENERMHLFGVTVQRVEWSWHVDPPDTDHRCSSPRRAPQ